MSDEKNEQIRIAERLQMKLLRRWEQLLDSGEMQATDAATLARFLRDNGWCVDPAKLPQGLRGILTATIDASRLDEDDLYTGGTH